MESALSLARDTAAPIRDTPHLELIRDPELSAVLFRRTGWQAEDYTAWSDRLLAGQVAFVAPTGWEGETVARFTFQHPETTATSDLTRALESQWEHLRTNAASLGATSRGAIRALSSGWLHAADAWGKKYPAIVRLWENAWEEFTPFLRFDTEIRRIVCTTNAIESVNARIRRAVKARGHFPNETAALKCVYMAIMSLDPTGKGQARWTMRWKTALNACDITFDGRLSAARQ